MSNRYEGGDLVVESLTNLGVSQIFTVSGGPLNSIYHAASASELEVVHTRHETAACFMADAVARVSGTPGVAVVTLGPAVANTVTGALMASLAGVPILIIGGQSSTRLFDTGTDMSVDHIQFMTSLTKFSARVLDTDRIPEYIETAWRAMWAGRPGPAFLEIPINVLSGPAERQPPASGPAARTPGLDPTAAAAVADALSHAKRPLAIVGDEARWDMQCGFDPAKLRAALERHRMPFSLIRLARGLVDERHQLCVGPGNVFANPTLAASLGKSDMVLLLGHHLECDLDFGSHIRDDAKVVQCYCDGAYIGKGRRSDVAAVTSVSAVVEHLLELSPAPVEEGWIEASAGAWRDFHGDVYGRKDADSPLHPNAVVHAIADVMPGNTIYATGHGNVDYWADCVLQPRHPNTYMRGGLGGAIGPEVPYGVGARFCRPDSPVVVFVGDGAIGYHGLELDTAERYGRPIIIVVMDDQKWGAIALPQARKYGGEFAVDLKERDWPGFATALGAEGVRAESVEDVRRAVEGALSTNRPTLIHVPVQCVISPYMDAFGH